MPIAQRTPAEWPATFVAQAALTGFEDRGKTGQDRKRVWFVLRQIVSGTRTLALADQAVVSGASFLTLILVSRWTNPSQVGHYSIGISMLLSTIAVQYSLVSLPYTIQRHNPFGTPT